MTTRGRGAGTARRWWVALLGAVLAAGAARAEPVEIRPPAPGPGEVFEVRLEDPGPGGPWRVRFDGREFLLWPSPEGGWEGLVAVDRDAPPGEREIEVRSREGRVAWSAAVTVAPREYGVQRLVVSERMVTLSPEDAARAARETRLIRETLAGISAPRLWEGPFRVPARGPVSSPFGTRRVYNGKPRSYHSGLDIAAPRGAEVRAAAAGRVALAREFFYTGRTVFLDHGLGLFTAYFHMDTIRVKEGEPVEAGAVLGTVGSTGRSTGPHLHWGVYLDGVKVDPLSLVRVTGGDRTALTGTGGRGE